MIKSVTVKNYIFIDEITLEFDKGFNVFTGETGAGKSIIIGAIDAALGAKTAKDAVKKGAEKAYIELVIKLDSEFDKSVFDENGIEITDNELIISKEILLSSSRSRINGILVTPDYIKSVRERLADIHTQQQNYNYIRSKNHITLLDDFAPKSHRDNVIEFREKYTRYINLQKRLESVQNIIDTSQRQADFLEFQIKEIDDAAITDVREHEILEEELDILAASEKLKELSYSSYEILNGGEENILHSLSTVKSNISKLSSMDGSLLPLEEDFINAYEILREISSRLRNYSETREIDGERMDYIGERLSLLDKLKRKYGNTLENVLKTRGQMSDELESIQFSADEAEKLGMEIKALNIELNNLALIISEERKKLADVLSKAVTFELEKLELPKSRFEIDITPCEMNGNGIDKVEFLIAANVSELPRPLAKTASGGEISRVILAVKSVFAKADKTNTVIFDEIDTGISGKASQAAAEALINLSKTHQIILITHQPIIAAKADSHFYVKKEQTDTTNIKVYNLKGENRVKAVALLASGEITEQSVSFAKDLLGI